MKRRNFLSLAVGAAACAASGQANGTGSTQIPVLHAPDDRNGTAHPLGVSVLAYKVVTADTQGALFVAEQMIHAKAGTPLHMHLEQDEWFYVLEGEFLVELGGVRHVLTAGDSVLGPRQVPHRWLFTGKASGKILVSFAPAGKMESFFEAVAKTGAMPGEDKELFASHGMVLLGPGLQG
ncbi:MAG TPA: cupin domain-containing protein [Terracidiphilus sp.]|nr:cupin domain-containing protein [Terracidiphilus sp.]